MTSPVPAEQAVVRLSTPADILGVMPHRLGFHPRESLVVICLEGPRRRDRLVMRADLGPEEQDAAMTADLVARAAHVRASGAVVVCYTEAPSSGPGLPRSGLVDALCAGFRADGIEVVEALLVSRGRWWSYRCRDEACCPRAGTPLPTELTAAAGRYAAESVLLGAAVLADREELARGIEPYGHPVAVAVREQAAATAGELLLAAVDAEGFDASCRVTVEVARRLASDWAAGSCQLDPVDAAVVSLGMLDKRARDEVMTLVLDHEPAVLVALLTEIARRTGDLDAAPVCTVLAWAAYADGGGALAAVAAERALRADPTYSMAQLVLDGLNRMVPPAAIRQVAADVRGDLESGADS
jgi:hypothetical protein